MEILEETQEVKVGAGGGSRPGTNALSVGPGWWQRHFLAITESPVGESFLGLVRSRCQAAEGMNL